jgi:alpha-glucosidase
MAKGNEWWRSAVIYQIYPRSFADGLGGNGIGDLPGITSRLDALTELGVDAVWLSPFYPSSQKDAGYDVADYCNVDPLFGTLDDFDALEKKVHALGLKLIVDLVPNHTSDQHAWFVEALAAPEGSEARGHYMFRDGKGPAGDLPPNNWESVFGGSAWSRVTRADGTPGQWYLHLFDSSQPDLDWTSPWVRERFREILRFWLDRGVDGFRVDVAHGLMKAPGLPDYTPPVGAGSMGGGAVVNAAVGLEPEILGHSLEVEATPPYWAQNSVHEIYRDWHELLEQYPGERVLCAEAWVEPLAKLARWVRPDEMQQAFNFSYLETPWDAPSIRIVVDASIAAFASVGAPSTWVLSNHDVVRHATRLSLTGDHPQGNGVGLLSKGIPDRAFGLHRARAATALMLALPGSSYLYQGEELGLPEVVDLPDASRQDPTWFRTNHKRYGRDGCRVPIPWEADSASFGFSTGDRSWLPQPAYWREYARDVQRGDPASTLELYRLALRLRASERLGTGALTWLDGYPPTVLAFTNAGVTVIANLGTAAVPMPAGDLLLASGPLTLLLPPDTTVWLRV